MCIRDSANTLPAWIWRSNVYRTSTSWTPPSCAAARTGSSAAPASLDSSALSASGPRSPTVRKALSPACRRWPFTNCATPLRNLPPGSIRTKGSSMPKRLIIAAALILMAGAASAQDNVISTARIAYAAGQRPQALTMLASHLAATPRDVDARLVYGLMLSWDRRYDEARSELQQVLIQTPDYRDARVALMNVEWWSGHTSTASDLATQILTRDPGDPQARLMRQRLDAQTRPWQVKTGYSLDSFNDGGAPSRRRVISVGREPT